MRRRYVCCWPAARPSRSRRMVPSRPRRNAPPAPMAGHAGPSAASANAGRLKSLLGAKSAARVARQPSRSQTTQAASAGAAMRGPAAAGRVCRRPDRFEPGRRAAGHGSHTDAGAFASDREGGRPRGDWRRICCKRAAQCGLGSIGRPRVLQGGAQRRARRRSIAPQALGMNEMSRRCLDEGLRACGNPQLAARVLEVEFDRALAQAEDFADLAERLTARGPRQCLHFPFT